MAKYLREFANNAEYEAYINGNPYMPNVSLIDADDSVKYQKDIDYSKRYLTFVALEDGTFKQTKALVYVNYSLDGGETWTSLNPNKDTPTIHQGEKIMWKGNITPSGGVPYGSAYFTSTGQFEVEGNPMSLLFGDNFIGQTDLTGKNSAFRQLFSGSIGLTSAKNIVLPATTLSDNCYQSMFEGCTSLTTAPELPATTLANSCYASMFKGCTPLTKAPELPATAITNGCYGGMFQDCTSLTTAPSLPATTLADNCYGQMFNGCTSLTTAPELSATTLGIDCCIYMFLNCTSLTTAPELPATTLADRCYFGMFRGCSNLNYIKMLATTLGTNSLFNWCIGVSATGTFVKAASQTSLPRGENGIPANWTIQNA